MQQLPTPAIHPFSVSLAQKTTVSPVATAHCRRKSLALPFFVSLSLPLSLSTHMSVPQLSTSATCPFSASLAQKKPVPPVATAHRCQQNSLALSLFRSLSAYMYIYICLNSLHLRRTLSQYLSGKKSLSFPLPTLIVASKRVLRLSKQPYNSQ